jgi:hypothetical protein
MPRFIVRSIRHFTIASLVLGGVTFVSSSLVTSAGAATTPTCTPTGFVRDGINLTAAEIDPHNVFGTVNATGCNIGVYFGAGSTGQVLLANVYGANYYGIVNDGANVNISLSNIHNIGDVPFDGDQHGVGIYFNYDSGATGSIIGNSVSEYQKGGIVVNGGNDSATISSNIVTGQGQVNYIAQNGIQVAYGASGSISNNYVSGNAYTGANDASSAGILVFGGCGDPQVTNLHVDGNTLVNNDMGIYDANYDAGCDAPSPVKTGDLIENNSITNNAISNISGNDNGTVVQGYQAGILDIGNGDVISNNSISGIGYTPAITTGPTYVIAIDTSFTTNATVENNRVGASTGGFFGQGIFGIGRFGSGGFFSGGPGRGSFGQGNHFFHG